MRNDHIRRANTYGRGAYFMESATPLHITEMRRAVCQRDAA